MARIEGGEHPAPEPLDRRDSQNSQNSQPPAAETEKYPAQRAPAQFAEFAEFATGEHRTAPPTCAACGLADWRVSLTEPDGRKLHVACWQREAGI
ncbi:hypothetical protein [Thetidibacter halocola]|uniref:Uncharacterized protein n=1 Tax=Thetidibacter halocola TaxID=2827239 RepID=A0A8J8B6C4_9RHOB|nr:hypothetical protein [Thetidibacter halocola]MBS0122524.1 hypothetical protein [Thetidibacter halocola]